MVAAPTSRYTNRRHQRRCGTMMTEIVVALVILGVLATIAAPQLFGAIPL